MGGSGKVVVRVLGMTEDGGGGGGGEASYADTNTSD